ncbi:MAG: DUF421 domain-containing protein [Halanaerobiales bacterium]
MYEIIEIIIQTVFAFFSIFFFSRFIGKKQISELTFYDYINGITIGSIAGIIATDLDQRTWHHFLGLFIFVILTLLMQYISLKSRSAQKLIEGEPVVLIHRGKILEENMRKARFNIGDLLSGLRKKEIFDIKDVYYALLETDGSISVLPDADKKMITCEDLDLKGNKESINVELIVDGKVIQSNLVQNDLDKKWLDRKMEEYNIPKIEDVVLASYNPVDETLYFDLKKDNTGKDTVDISDDLK